MKRIQLILIIIMTSFATNVMAQAELIRKGQRPTKITLQEEATDESDSQLFGYWTEYKRTYSAKRNKEVNLEFADTIKLKLMADSSLYQFYAMGKTIQGNYGFEGDKFYYHADKTLYDFTLEKEGKFTIRNQGITSYFKKVDKLYFPPIEKVVPNATTGKIDKLDAAFLQGNWKVYKKVDPAFDRGKVYLYKFEIGERVEPKLYKITAHYDNAGTIVSDTGTVVVKENTLRLHVMNQSISYKVTMAHQDELVLQDGDVVYFLKK